MGSAVCGEPLTDGFKRDGCGAASYFAALARSSLIPYPQRFADSI
ncbi:hypothetical protein [Leptolyngbya sp. FACHB-36]|nr:hypothetical protein [Leptolyngbya sp. FACHB-36]